MQNNSLEERIDDCTDIPLLLSDLREEIESLESRIDDLESDIKDKDNKIEELEDDISELNNQKDDLNERIYNLENPDEPKEDNSGLEEKIRNLYSIIDERDEDIRILHQKLDKFSLI